MTAIARGQQQKMMSGGLGLPVPVGMMPEALHPRTGDLPRPGSGGYGAGGLAPLGGSVATPPLNASDDREGGLSCYCAV